MLEILLYLSSRSLLLSNGLKHPRIFMLPRTLVAVVGRKDPRFVAALLFALLFVLRGCCWLAVFVLADNSGLGHDLLGHES